MGQQCLLQDRVQVKRQRNIRGGAKNVLKCQSCLRTALLVRASLQLCKVQQEQRSNIRFRHIRTVQHGSMHEQQMCHLLTRGILPKGLCSCLLHCSCTQNEPPTLITLCHTNQRRSANPSITPVARSTARAARRTLESGTPAQCSTQACINSRCVAS
jgi:hypothetical protein